MMKDWWKIILILFKNFKKTKKNNSHFFFYEFIYIPPKFETLFGGTIVGMYHIQNVMVPEWSKGEGETPLVKIMFSQDTSESLVEYD